MDELNTDKLSPCAKHTLLRLIGKVSEKIKIKQEQEEADPEATQKESENENKEDEK